MCAGLVIAGSSFTLAAADTRYAEADAVHSFTGRTRRIPGGWCSSTGSAAVVLRGLRELEHFGVPGAEEAVEKAYREVAEFRVPDSPSRFLIAADSSELLDIVTGRPTERMPVPASGLSYVGQPPPGLADDGQQATQALLDALSKARTIEAVVRAVAGFVRDCHAQGGRVSDEVEIGVTVNGQARYCHAAADELADATDAEVSRRFTTPPTLPAFPYLPIEQLIFSQTPTIEV